jgi:hypothetical protein
MDYEAAFNDLGTFVGVAAWRGAAQRRQSVTNNDSNVVTMRHR